MERIGQARAPKWTEEEDNILREHYPTMRKKVADLLPERTEAACAIRAAHLKIAAHGPWTEQEDEVLREIYPDIGDEVSKYLPNRSRNACRKRAAELQIPHVHGTWTKSEDDILRTYYPQMGIAVRDLIPYRSRQSIYRHAIRLGIAKEGENGEEQQPMRFWTPEEEAILRAEYPRIGSKVQQLLPNRTLRGIYGHVRQLNLTRL